MPLDAPFKLGRFLIDLDGRMRLDAPDAAPTMHLEWHGLSVAVRLAATAEDGRLTLSAVVGRVPSTASHRPDAAAQRGQTLARLQDLAGAMPAGWRLALLPDHRARIEGQRGLRLPASAGALLTEVTCFLLDLAPYLDLLEESGFGMEAAGGAISAGMANT